MKKLLFILFIIISSFQGFGQADSSNQDLKFDFGITRGRNVNLWPLFVRQKNEDSKDIQVMFTMFRYKKEFKTESLYSHLLPLYFYKNNEQKKDFRLLSLYYPSVMRTYHDKVNDIKTFQLFDLAPEINFFEATRSKDGLFIKNNAFFFIWFKQDKKLDKSYLVVFPLSWYYRDKQKYNYTLFPLFSRGIDYRTTHNFWAITPLFFKYKNATQKETFLFPLWYHTVKSIHYKTNLSVRSVLFPIYFSYKFQDTNNVVFFPLVFKYQSKFYKSFTLFPLFSYGKSDDSIRKHLGITPLYWDIKNNKNYKRLRFLIPLFAYQNTYINYEKRNRHHLWIAPLYWYTSIKYDDNTITHDHNKRYDFTRNMFFPIFYHKVIYHDIRNPKATQFYTSDTLRRTVVFPLVWYKKDIKTNNLVVFPFMWKLEDRYYKSLTVLPFFSKGMSKYSTEKHLAITPFYWCRYEISKYSKVYKNNLFPFVYSTVKYTKARKDSNTYRKSVHYIPADTMYRTIVFPLFWSKIEKDKYDRTYKNNLFPIVFSRFEYRKERVDTFWDKSLSFRKADSSCLVVLFPLLWYYQKGDSRKTIVFPIFWKSNYGLMEYTAIMPFFAKGKNSKYKDKFYAVTPLFWHVEKEEYNGYENFDTYSKRNILFPLIWNNTKYLYDHRGIKGGVIWDTLKNNVVFPLYWSYNRINSRTKILFPFVWSFKEQISQTTTIFPVYFKKISKDKNYSSVMITPLYWNFKSPNKNYKTLVPLFDCYHKGKDTSWFSISYFLFRYKKNADKKSFSTIWPLIEYEKGNKYSYFRAAPVLWYKKSVASNYFSVQPLFYHSKDSTSERFNIFWILYNYRNIYNVKKSNSILWKVFFWDRYTNKDYETRLLYKVFSNVNLNGNKEQSVFPVYHKTQKENGEKSTALFFGFYNSFKQKIYNTNEFYQEKRIFWFVRIASNAEGLKKRGIIDKDFKPKRK